MKRIALVIVLLYFGALLALTWPVVRVAFWGTSVDFPGVVGGLYYPCFIVIMVLGQAALLALPVQVASRQPITRRSLLWPVLVSGLMIGGLVVGAEMAMSEFVQRGAAFSTGWEKWTVLAAGALTWLVWTVVFYRMSRASTADDVISRQCRLMFRGSVLELLVAVPTHIVARHRDYCCAGVATFVGIALGIAVMLLSFGPAVFFLYADRWKRVQTPKGSSGAPIR
jgi:hypothetical protein